MIEYPFCKELGEKSEGEADFARFPLDFDRFLAIRKPLANKEFFFVSLGDSLVCRFVNSVESCGRLDGGDGRDREAIDL